MNGNVAIAGVIAMFAALTSYAADMHGVVTVDRTRHLRGVVVKVETAGQVFVTRTGNDGTFSVTGVVGNSALVSVLQDGRLIYRNYHDPASPTAIDLEGAGPKIPKGFEPNALAVLFGGEVIVASADSKLYRFQMGSYQNATPVTDSLSDVAAGDPSGPAALYACGPAGRLIQYNSDLKAVDSWSIGRVSRMCTSVAVDSAMVYVGNGKEKAIFRLRRGERQAGMFVTMDSAAKIGALAVDTNRRRLFVADPEGGKIFVVGFVDRKVRQFAHGLGEVRALVVDPHQNRLYAADAAKDRIWQFDLTAAAPAAGDFAGFKNVRSAYALGLDSDGTLWVGDRKYDALLAFKPDGQLKTRIDAK